GGVNFYQPATSRAVNVGRGAPFGGTGHARDGREKRVHQLNQVAWHGSISEMRFPEPRPTIGCAAEPNGATFAPLAPVLRGEGTGVRGSGLSTTPPHPPPTPLPRSTGGEGGRSQRAATFSVAPVAWNVNVPRSTSTTTCWPSR